MFSISTCLFTCITILPLSDELFFSKSIVDAAERSLGLLMIRSVDPLSPLSRTVAKAAVTLKGSLFLLFRLRFAPLISMEPPWALCFDGPDEYPVVRA